MFKRKKEQKKVTKFAKLLLFGQIILSLINLGFAILIFWYFAKVNIYLNYFSISIIVLEIFMKLFQLLLIKRKDKYIAYTIKTKVFINILSFLKTLVGFYFAVVSFREIRENASFLNILLFTISLFAFLISLFKLFSAYSHYKKLKKDEEKKKIKEAKNQ